MDNFNEINSYNSLMMSPENKKEFRVSTSYSSTKMNIGSELNGTSNKNEMNSFKRVSIDLHNKNPQKLIMSSDKVFSNIQNISTKEEDSSSSTFTKLPKIQKHLTSATLSDIKNKSNTFFNNTNNSPNSNNQKDYSSLKNNNSTTNNSNMTYRISNNSKANNKNRSYYMGSANSIYSNYMYKYNYNSLISPPDPLLKRTAVPKVNPRFGKMKEYIKLPEFKGEEPIIKFEYKPILKEMLTSPSIEKQYEVGLYLNSNKMLNNLIYLKTQLNRDGLISLENLVNIKKLNKYYKNEAEEEDEIMEIYPDNNNFQNNALDNSNNGNNGNEANSPENNNKNDEKLEIGVSRNNNNFSNKDNSSTNFVNHKLLKNNSLLRNKFQRPKTVFHELKPFYTLKNKNDNTLIFESRFESGNLLCAFRTEDENSYQLYLQNDTNTTGYIQWFFFRVSNTRKGNKVNFNIINMLRSSCLYKKGLKIMTYSKLQAQNENIGWHRDCENIMYYTNNLFTYNDNSKKKRSLSSLSFDYEFKYDNDKVYFANCLPYFYSKLIDEIELYEKKLKNKFFFFKIIPLTQTLGGNDLILLNINSQKNKNIIAKSNDISLPQLNKSFNHSFMNLLNSSNSFKVKNNENKKTNNKKTVFMIGRQHPGETVGSHVIKGCIDFLLGDSDEAKKLREIYDFQIVPMMNPDGVIVGNSRTGFAGCDLNRRWSKPNEIIHPEIFYIKSLILNTAVNQNISFVIDFHGHFGTYNSLFYCNHKENKKKCSLFPFLCSKLSNIISFQQTTFSMPKYKASTERLSLFRELEDIDNDNIVALETSFFGTHKNNPEEKNYYFNTKLLYEIGRDVCLGMLSYYIKCENISIEKNLNEGWDEIKKFDIDIQDFENEIDKEIINDNDDGDDKEELSESEPSIDNFDKKEILKLMPVVAQKKKKKKGKNISNGAHNNYKIKKIEKYLTKRKYGGNSEKNNLDKNKIDLDIELYNPLKELISKKADDNNKKKPKPNKNTPIKYISNFQLIKKPMNKSIRQIHTSNQNQQQPIQPHKQTEEPKTKDEYTQTDEVFFRMHWTYFVGKYKILNCKRRYNNLPNISNAPFNMTKLNQNLFGRFFNKRNNFILINERYKKSDWTKLGNSNQLDQNRKQNGNFNIMSSLKNYSLKDKNIKPIYLNKINRNPFSTNKHSTNQK